MDLAEAASLPANKVIQHADRLKELKIKLKGMEDKDIFLDGDRQTLRESVLTIQKESIPSPSLQGQADEGSKELEKSMGSDLFIQSDHPVIQSKAKEIVSTSDSDRVKAEKLIRWVHEKIEKRPVLSVPSALETLQNGVGDCNEHAVLLAALARASGIPSQVEAGLVYQRGRFYYHAWNILYLDRWITADAVMGQFPADVTHIRFVRGTERQVDLIRIIGNIQLEILSFF
jgi:transglutaminase-like putative cysteine protease